MDKVVLEQTDLQDSLIRIGPEDTIVLRSKHRLSQDAMEEIKNRFNGRAILIEDYIEIAAVISPQGKNGELSDNSTQIGRASCRERV